MVTDFGVARIEGLPPAYVDREGPIFHRGVGAPEQFAGEDADVRTGIYQLGALLLVTLTGKFPFEGGVQLMDEDTDVPQELRETIRRCLEVVREQRFQDVADLKNALLPRRSFAIPSPSAPGVLITPRLRELWEFPIDTPNWRIWTTPVLDISGGCYLWGRQKLTRLDPDTGDVLWSWSPGERDRQSGIRSSPHSFAVHTDGQLIYVRQESLLSCLHASNGALQWEHALSSNVGGAFLLAGDLVILDSYRPQGRGLLGPAALDAKTGEMVWNKEEPYFHVSSISSPDTTLMLLEGRGMGEIGGSRVRLLEASSGEVLAVQNLFETERIRPPRPLMMEDGAFVVWANNGRSDQLETVCFDAQLRIRWAELIELGKADPNSGASGDTTPLRNCTWESKGSLRASSHPWPP